MKESGWKKIIFEKNDSYENLETIIHLYGSCICMDSAFTGRSTPTTAFDGAIWYFANTM